MGRPVIIIGYSLGGAVARYLASKHSDKVKYIITIGSPSLTTDKIDPFIYNLFRKFNPDCIEKCGCEFVNRLTARSSIPEMLIYSKEDGVVHWSDSILNVPSENCREVSGNHGELAVSPEVYRLIASRLRSD